MTAMAGPSISLFYHDLNQALRMVAQKHRINLKAVKTDFNGKSPTGNILLQAEIQARSKLMEREQFEKIAPHYELGPEDFLATFTYNTTTFRLIGLRIKATSEPLLVQSLEDNKEYTFPLGPYKEMKSAKRVSYISSSRVAA